jgi:CheY-like chemotaxis protein
MPTARTYLLVGANAERLASLDRGFSQHAELSMVRRAHANSVDGVLRFLRGEKVPLRTLVVALHEPPAFDAVELLRTLRADPALTGMGVVVLDGDSGDPRGREQAFALHAAGVLPRPATSGEVARLATTVHGYWSMVEMP